MPAHQVNSRSKVPDLQPNPASVRVASVTTDAFRRDHRHLSLKCSECPCAVQKTLIDGARQRTGNCVPPPGQRRILQECGYYDR